MHNTKKLCIWLVILTFFFACKEKKTDTITSNKKLDVYSYAELEPLLKTDDNKTHIINFWATWCKPCVEELPIFQEVDQTYDSEKVEVILVSLDFPDKIDTNLKSFIAEHNITPRVIVLDDPHENEWIPKIDPEWSGALPATLIFNKQKRAFYEQSFTKEKLEVELKKFMKL